MLAKAGHFLLNFLFLIVLTGRLGAQSAPSPAESRLIAAVQLPTICPADSADFDPAPFEALRALLAEAYPLVHAHLDPQVMGGHSLLYTWKGSQDSLAPIMLYAHQDVVPVEEETRYRWSHAPYGGEMDAGYIWGRGTIDDKLRVIAIMEALEGMLASGYVPERSILVLLGHDEETGGWAGSETVREWMVAQGIRVGCYFDEGPSVVEQVMEGMDKPVALIGVAEKGWLNLKLTARGPGGHSSMPPAQTTIGILAGAIDRLESNPFPPRLHPVLLRNLQLLAPYLPARFQLGIRMHGILKGKIISALSENPVTDAVLRTKLSPTMIQGGVTMNVLPKEATALLNIRILQGDSIHTIIERVKEVIADERVEVTRVGRAQEASPVTDFDSPEAELLKQCVLETWPEVVVAPTLMPAGTDSKHFNDLADHIFRFTPVVATPDEAERIHGIDERVPVGAVDQATAFYTRLITAFSSQ